MEREDVRKEMQVQKDHFQGPNRTKTEQRQQRTALVFVGGDGLSYSQMIHEIADNPDEWMLVGERSLPALIPCLGLEPHGGYHGLHMGWRNWRVLVVSIGERIGSAPMCIIDPPVSAYNMMRFEQYKLTRGVSEWLQLIAKTKGAPDLSFAEEWLDACVSNIDFEWVCRFLFDFGFWWLEFMHARRRNRSSKLDDLWKEFICMGRTMVANKTNYGFMAVMQASVCVRECVHVTTASPRAPLTPSWVPYGLCGPGVGARAKEQL